MKMPFEGKVLDRFGDNFVVAKETLFRDKDGSVIGIACGYRDGVENDFATWESKVEFAGARFKRSYYWGHYTDSEKKVLREYEERLQNFRKLTPYATEGVKLQYPLELSLAVSIALLDDVAKSKGEELDASEFGIQPGLLNAAKTHTKALGILAALAWESMDDADTLTTVETAVGKYISWVEDERFVQPIPRINETGELAVLYAVL